MRTHRTSFTSYRLTTIRPGGRFCETDYGVRVLGAPTVGRPMVMYGGSGNRRIVTSRVVRLFEDASADGTFVQTENTLYLLQRGSSPVVATSDSTATASVG